MIPPEVLQQIRRIQIQTRRAVNEVFAGEYESTFKGRGMQFDEVREYTPGDDVRSIDWNVTARTGRPHVKRYVEERELTVMLVVDVSASGAFGTVRKFKRELAAELCAVLAFSAINNNDKVGLITFSDRIERFVPPQKGTRHVLRVIRELLYAEPTGRGTDIAAALEYLARVSKKRVIAFLVSDFLDKGIEQPLRLVGRRHDLISVVVRDPWERAMGRLGLVEWEDAETGQPLLVDTSSRRFAEAYAAQRQVADERLERLLAGAQVDRIWIRSDRPYVPELVRFFKRRERRR